MANIYEIPLPGGGIAEFEGDVPPTDKELNDLFNIPFPKGVIDTAIDSTKDFVKEAKDIASTMLSTDQSKYYIESKKGEKQKNQELMDAVNKQLTGAAPAPSQEGDVDTFGDALLASGEQIKDVVGPPLLRYGVPIAAALATGGVAGMAAPMIFTGIGAMVGEDPARALEKRQPMSGMEGITTFTGGTMMTPLKQYAGLANTVVGGGLEGLGFGSMPAAEENRLPTKRELAAGFLLGSAGRGVEGAVLSRVAHGEKQAARAFQMDRELLAEQNAQFRNQLQEEVQSGVHSYVPSDGMPTPFDLYVTQGNRQMANDARIAYEEQMARTAQPVRPAVVAAETLVPEGAYIPAKSASSSADVFTQLSERDQKIADFNAARLEEASVSLKNELDANRLGSGESTIFETPQMVQRARLDVDLGPGSGATRERTRLLNQADVAEPTAAGKAFERQQGQLSRMSMSAQANRMNQEYGKIDPAIMIGIGRTAVGAVGGQYFGDDPEEKIGYGLLGALAGFAAGRLINKVFGAAVKVADKLKKGNMNWVTDIAIKPFIGLIHASTDDAKALLVPSKFAEKQLREALNLYTNQAGRQQANRYVYEFLTKQRELKDIPRNLQVASQNARDAIDAISDELVARGVVYGKLKDTVLNNRGSYVRRAYQVHSDPDYRPTQQVFDNFVNKNVADELAIPGNTQTRAELQQKYTNEANNLLDSYKADRGIYKERDPNISLEKRQLLGEVNDPLILLNHTVPRMAKAAATYQWKKEAVAIGERLGLMTKQSDSAINTKLLAAADDMHNPFAGYYTTPEIRAAFESYTNDIPGDFMKVLGTVSSALKIPKTLGSINAYATNVAGGTMDLLSQGHATQLLSASNRKNVWDAMRTSFGIVDGNGRLINNKVIKLYQDFVREGLVGKSITGQDFAKTFDESFFHKANSAGSDTIEFLGKLYSTPETAAKLFNFYGEMKTLRQAYGNAMSEAEMFKLAAAKVRQTTTYYEALPKALRKASQLGALDPFVAYTADRYRIVYNTYKIGMGELRSGNPALMKAGAARLLATTTMLAGAATLGANLHIPAAMRDALRSKVKDYDKSGTIVMNPPDKDGDFSYTNLSYLIPSSIVMEGALSAARGDSPSEAWHNFWSTIGQQFLGSPLWLKPYQDLKNNSKYGNPIYSELDSVVFADKPFSGERTQAGDIGKYLINELAVPSAVNKIRNMIEAKDGAVIRPSGRKVSIENELLSLASLRVTNLNLPTTTLSEAKAFAGQENKNSTMYKEAQKIALTDRDKQNAYGNFERRYQQTFKDVSEWVDNSKKLGMSDDNLAEIGKEANIPSHLILGALDKQYVPPPVEAKMSASEQIVKFIEDGKSKAQILNEIIKLQRTSPPEAMALKDAYKSNLHEVIRGASPKDKLLLGFNSTDGSRADYLATQLQSMQQTQGPLLTHAYLQGLVKKGVINKIDAYHLRSRHGITLSE